MKIRLLFLTTLLLCSLLFCGCTQTVEFSAAEVPADTEELSIVLQSGETALLSELSALKSVDLSGSLCYEEIFNWAQLNPNVKVIYTIELPDGTVVDNCCKALDLSRIDVSHFDQLIQLMAYLPQLETVKLSDKTPLSAEEFTAFLTAYPDINYFACFEMHGQSFSTDEKSLDMTGISSSEAEDFCLVLPAMKKLESVELGDEQSSPELNFTLVSSMQKACPGANFNYGFTLFDKSFTTADTEMDFRKERMRDNGAAVMEAISCMPKLEFLDMDGCGVADEDMEKIRDAYPNVNVVWRVWFGDNYCVRTDVEKILASMPSVGGELTPENTVSLKYCTKVKYIDVGHNSYLTDISFASYMPELEVAIFAMDYFTDLSPLLNCPNLEFLEIQTSEVSDISALSGMKKLRHLNICYLYELDDISPIMDLELERLWIGDLSPVPQEQIDEYQRLHPDCRISTANRDPHDGGWRYDQDAKGAWGMHPRYEKLVKQFGYDSAGYAFPWKDPLYLY